MKKIKFIVLLLSLLFIIGGCAKNNSSAETDEIDINTDVKLSKNSAVFKFDGKSDKFYVETIDGKRLDLDVNLAGGFEVPESVEIEGNKYIIEEIGPMTAGSIKTSSYVNNFVVKLPDTVKKIDDGAFDNVWVNEINIPKSCVYIGDSAFSTADIANIVIPETVKYIGKNAFFSNDFTSLEINAKDITIGDRAFSECDELETVKLSGLTTVSNYMFDGCDNLKSVELSNTVKHIGEYAFYGCEALTEIKSDFNFDYVGDAAFGDTPFFKELMESGDIVTRGAVLFKYKTTDKNITIQNGIKVITENAFEESRDCEEIVLPEGLTQIGASAFRFVDKLNKINLPDSIKVIGREALRGKLTSIKLPASLERIGSEAFRMYSLAEVTGETPNLTYVGMDVFLGTTWVENMAAKMIEEGKEPLITLNGILVDASQVDSDKIRLSDDVKSLVNNYVFSSTKSKSYELIIPAEVKIEPFALAHGYFNKLVFEEGRTVIPEYMCYGLSNVDEIIIPEGVTEIGAYAFQGSEIGRIELPSTVKIIRTEAFDRNWGENSLVNIPENIELIEKYAIDLAYDVTEVTLPDSLKVLEAYAIEGSNVVDCYIGNGLEKISESSLESFDLTCTYHYKGKEYKHKYVKDQPNYFDLLRALEADGVEVIWYTQPDSRK